MADADVCVKPRREARRDRASACVPARWFDSVVATVVGVPFRRRRRRCGPRFAYCLGRCPRFMLLLMDDATAFDFNSFSHLAF